MSICGCRIHSFFFCYCSHLQQHHAQFLSSTSKIRSGMVTFVKGPLCWSSSTTHLFPPWQIEESSKADFVNLETWNSAMLILPSTNKAQKWNSYCLIPIPYHWLSNFTTNWKISQSLIFVVWDKYAQKRLCTSNIEHYIVASLNKLRSLCNAVSTQIHKIKYTRKLLQQ